MAKWIGTLTETGAKILADFSDRKLTVTSVSGSDGLVNEEELEKLTELTGNLTPMGITGYLVEGNVRKLYLQKTNIGMDTPFIIHQSGYFVTVDDGPEQLFAVNQSLSGEYIPASAEMPEFVWEPIAALGFGAAANVIIIVTPEALATVDYVTRELAAKQDIIDVTGLLKGTGDGNIEQAIPGEDYATPESVGEKQDAITTTGILKGMGEGEIAQAIPGEDYATPENIQAAINAKIIIRPDMPPVVEGALWVKI